MSGPMNYRMRDKYRMRKAFSLLLLFTVMISLFLLFPSFLLSQGIGNLTAPGNKHNLSATQTGTTIKALYETQICVFCHTPHRATVAPLWNKRLSTATYTMPARTPTQLTTPLNPPDGASRLCLSCHDGTIPLGEVQNLWGSQTTIAMTGPLCPGPNCFGTDLSGHHLISIEYNVLLANDKATQCGTVSYRLKNPPPSPPLSQRTESVYPCDYNLNPNGCRDPHNPRYGVQCTSCHDPHYDPTPGITKFLRYSSDPQGPWPWNNYSPLCLQCHEACP